MGQLLKVTSTPFQAIHFTQNARLVPTDNIDIERRKVMARHFAFNSRYSVGRGSIDLEYVNQINKAFSTGHSAGQPAVSLPGQGAGSQDIKTAVSSGKTPSYTGNTEDYSVTSTTASVKDSIPLRTSVSQPSVDRTVIPETQAAYTMQRGSFELRVAKGELSYIPPLVMTIITQYPDIDFEYTGGFNYVPPREDNLNNIVNLSI